MISTLDKLSTALGNPEVQNDNDLVDSAVEAIKHTQDLQSGLEIVENRNAELVEQERLSRITIDRARHLTRDLRNSIHVLRNLQSIAADCEVELRNEVGELKNSLNIASEIDRELREYINHLLDLLQTQRKVLKIIAAAACSESLHPGLRCGTVCRLVDNALAGHYDD